MHHQPCSTPAEFPRHAARQPGESLREPLRRIDDANGMLAKADEPTLTCRQHPRKNCCYKLHRCADRI